GLYTPPDYDLAGFIVGYVEEDEVLGPHRVRPDDVLIALPSSGLHTNGYSLARKIVANRLKLHLTDAFPEVAGSVADVLLAEHKSYLPALKPVLERVHAMAHITGGGLPENLDRALPPTLDAVLGVSSWRVPSVLGVLMEAGQAQVDPQRCRPGTTNGCGGPDQTRAARDACQKAIDLFKYMAPQLGTAIAGGNPTLGQGGNLGGLGHFSAGIRLNAVQGNIP